jgi:hypothetical protein
VDGAKGETVKNPPSFRRMPISSMAAGDMEKDSCRAGKSIDDGGHDEEQALRTRRKAKISQKVFLRAFREFRKQMFFKVFRCVCRARRG